LQKFSKLSLGTFDPARLRVENICPVIFFAHGLDCPHCVEAIRGFMEVKDRLEACESEVFVVVPHAAEEDMNAFDPVHIVVDPSGEARAELAGLLEFDTEGKLLLFILNNDSSPSAAWVGDEANEPHLHERTLRRLDYISIQCPE
jgi:hypothetical protein